MGGMPLLLQRMESTLQVQRQTFNLQGLPKTSWKGVSKIDDQNVILFLDKIKKLLELGNKPKAITEIESLEILLQRQINLKKGKRFLPIVIPETTETERANPIFLREFELASKVNEIINFLNDRHQI